MPPLDRAPGRAHATGSVAAVQVVIGGAGSEAAPHRQDARWRFALSAATWPEVLRCYVLTRLYAQATPLVSLDVAQAANALSRKTFAQLKPAQKAGLLALCCDEALDTAAMRTELRERAERVEQARF